MLITCNVSYQGRISNKNFSSIYHSPMDICNYIVMSMSCSRPTVSTLECPSVHPKPLYIAFPSGSPPPAVNPPGPDWWGPLVPVYMFCVATHQGDITKCGCGRRKQQDPMMFSLSWAKHFCLCPPRGREVEP